jgi:REP element-mobilizing transposase RayT
MPRKPREELEGGIQHVWARGNDKRAIYRSDADRELYLATLALTVAAKGWHCLAYCLMENHLHLLVETPRANLGAGVQRLHGMYGRTFNDRHNRSGHVFQGRFGSKLIKDDTQFWTVARYIARNPVEAGLCRDPAEWRWSSHRATLEDSAPVWLDRGRLLERFGTMGGDPHSTYRAMVDG